MFLYMLLKLYLPYKRFSYSSNDDPTLAHKEEKGYTPEMYADKYIDNYNSFIEEIKNFLMMK